MIEVLEDITGDVRRESGSVAEDSSFMLLV